MSLLLKKRQQESLRSNGLNDPAVKPQQTTMMNANLSSNFGPAVNNESQSGYEISQRPTLTNVALQQRPPRSSYKEQSASMKALLQQSFTNEPTSRPKAKTVNDVAPGWSIPLDGEMKLPYSTDFQTEISPEMMKALNLPEGAYFETPVYIDPTTGNPIQIEAEHFKNGNAVEKVEQHGRSVESDWSKSA